MRQSPVITSLGGRGGQGRVRGASGVAVFIGKRRSQDVATSAMVATRLTPRRGKLPQVADLWLDFCATPVYV